MNRRPFIRGVLASSIAPMFLPGAGRIWVPPRYPQVELILATIPRDAKFAIAYLHRRAAYLENKIVNELPPYGFLKPVHMFDALIGNGGTFETIETIPAQHAQ